MELCECSEETGSGDMEDKKHMISFKSPSEEIKVFTIENDQDGAEVSDESQDGSEGLCKMFEQ